MQKFPYSLMVIIIACMVVGCAPRRLNSGGENVYLYSQAPNSCKYLGYITNPSVHKNLDLRSSFKDIQNDDINFLKNEGAGLGANVVVLVSEKRTEAKRYYVRSPKYFIIYEHFVSANAYFCPSGVIQRSRQLPYPKIQPNHLVKP